MDELLGLPILEFEDAKSLRDWLKKNHMSHQGIWLRLYKKEAGHTSVSFDQVLDQGLCFGWSESTRRKFDTQSYLQKFTPRHKKGTTSQRNLKRVAALIESGEMMDAGLKALGINKS